MSKQAATISRMRGSFLYSGLAGFGLAVVGLAGCYTVDFDEQRPDVYYCTADNQCSDNQACVTFRCVDDIGPQVRITLPEPDPLTPVDSTSTDLVVGYAADNFTISDSNAVVEGQGKILASIDNQEFSTVSVTPDGVKLDISAGLPLGAHRLWIQAVYGDLTPYDNPGATASVAFVVEEIGSSRPNVAITSPEPNRVHKVGEPLDVSIAVRRFELVDNANDCHAIEDCDPYAPDAECTAGCELTIQGHVHIYTRPDYPACLFNTPIGCNGDYILSLRPSESVSSSNSVATATIPGNRFTEPGTFTFSASLQYNDHDPYPNNQFVIFDQITLIVVE
jgi:hypothetical protein